jgi:hypothetical protein
MAGGAASAADFDSLKSELFNRLELDEPDVNEERYEIPRRDAVSYAVVIRGITVKLFNTARCQPKTGGRGEHQSGDYERIRGLGRMAQSELEAGIAEWALGSVHEL